MKKAEELFKQFLKSKGLKSTVPRLKILKEFMSTEGHHSVDELYILINSKHPEIGRTTVYRTIKLLCEADIASENYFNDRVSKYEMKKEAEHHDHMICIKCGKLFEVLDPRIEKLQIKLSEKHGFTAIDHRLEIIGYCRKCKTGKTKNGK